MPAMHYKKNLIIPSSCFLSIIFLFLPSFESQLLVILTLFTLVPLVVSLVKRNFFWTPANIFAIVYFVFYGIGILAYLKIFGSDGDLILTEIYVVIGLLCFYVGYYVPGKKGSHIFEPLAYVIDFKKLKYVLAIYMLIAICGLILYLNSVGGLMHLATCGYGGRGNPSIFAGLYCFLFPSLLMSLTLCLFDLTNRRLHFIIFMIIALICLAWFGPLRGSRRHIIYIASSVVLFLGLTKQLRQNKSIVLVFAIALLGIFVWSQFRVKPLVEIFYEIDRQTVQERTFSTFMGSLSAPIRSCVYIFHTYSDSDNLLLGKTFYESATAIIPRNLWPNKPQGFGVELINQINSRAGGNMVPTILGEFYVNFGFIGVILGMFFLGFFSKYIYVKICGPVKRNAETISIRQALFYSAFAPIYVDLIWGYTGTAIWDVWLKIIPTWLALRFSFKEFKARPFRISG